VTLHPFVSLETVRSIPFLLNRSNTTHPSLSTTGELLFANYNFDGPLPQSIVNLENLEVLDLSSNLFNGLIPIGFSNLTSLLILNLSRNVFGGTIPVEIGTMTELIEIRLDTNAVDNNPNFGFQGPIPASIGALNNLVRLDLYENRLTGTLPKEIGSVGSIEIYDVAFNTGIEGVVPEEYDNLVNLQEFFLNGTSVEGAISDAICAFEAYIEVGCGADVDIQCSCCTCGADERENVAFEDVRAYE
jgi:hypothetical protein